MRTSSKSIFLDLILSLILLFPVCQYGFSKDVADTYSHSEVLNVEASPQTESVYGDKSPLPALDEGRKSKLTETKKEVRSAYQSSSDSADMDLSTVRSESKSTASARLSTTIKLLDEETVQELANVFDHFNQDRDSLLAASGADLYHIGIIMTEIKTQLEIHNMYQFLEIGKKAEKRVSEAKAYRWMIGLLMISIILWFVSARRDWEIAKWVFAALFVLSAYATVRHSSDRLPKRVAQETKIDVQKEELGEENLLTFNMQQ